MALTNEDLLAISQLLDTKLDARLNPIENRLEKIEDKVTNISLTLENMIKKVSEHNEKLQKIS